MTNEQVANELQDINGLLMDIEGLVGKYPLLPYLVFSQLWKAREMAVALARQFEPPLEADLPKRVEEALRYLRETPLNELVEDMVSMGKP